MHNYKTLNDRNSINPLKLTQEFQTTPITRPKVRIQHTNINIDATVLLSVQLQNE